MLTSVIVRYIKISIPYVLFFLVLTRLSFTLNRPINLDVALSFRVEGSDDLLKRVFLRAYGRQEYGLTKAMKQQELADWLTEQGYPTSLDDVKSGSRNRSNLPYQIIPVTLRVVRLMGVLINQWPDLEVDSFVQEGHAGDCWQGVIDSL